MFVTYEELCRQMGVEPLSKEEQKKLDIKIDNGEWLFSENEESPYK